MEFSLQQTCVLASRVRSKLTKEATSPSKNLRALVSHANLLDNIISQISQQRSVGFSLPSQESRQRTSYNYHQSEFDSDSDSDSDSDCELECDQEVWELDSDDDINEDIEDDGYYVIDRVPSHRI